MLSTLGMKEGEAIIHPWVNKSLEKAQAKVEGRNFDIRKQLLKFDDVMNEQRKVIFDQRRDIMEAEETAEIAEDMRHQVIDDCSGRIYSRQNLCRSMGCRRIAFGNGRAGKYRHRRRHVDGGRRRR